MEGERLLPAAGSPPTITVGGNPASVLSFQSGIPEIVTFVTPPGSPGLATLKVQTDRGVGTARIFFYDADTRTPPAVEDDTLLLWHLDEAVDGSARIADAGPFGLAGSGSSTSRALPGRFGFARSGVVVASADQGLLSIGSSGFTLECWVRTGPISRTYVLAGKTPGAWGSGYSLSIKPSGAVWGYLQDTANRFWETVSDPSSAPILDAQWHHLAMVTDRQMALLRLYVDGVERAASAQPAGFGDVSNTSTFAIGQWDAHDWSSGPTEFPGVVDEVRLSANPHSGARIHDIMLGQEGPLALEATHVHPTRVIRGSVHEIRVDGYNLAGVQADLFDPSGERLETEVLGSSATTARLTVQIPSSGPLGEAELRLHSDLGAAVLSLPILDPLRSRPVLEDDTLLLVHFDEETGQNRFADGGPFSVDFTTLYVSGRQFLPGSRRRGPHRRAGE